MSATTADPGPQHAGNDRTISRLLSADGRYGWEYLIPDPPRRHPDAGKVFTWKEPALRTDQTYRIERWRNARRNAVQHLVVTGILVVISLALLAFSTTAATALGVLCLTACVILAAAWFAPFLDGDNVEREVQRLREKAHAQFDETVRRHAQALDDWNRAEKARLAGIYNYYPITPAASDVRRLDVVGGVPRGWASLLLTHGSALLNAGRGLTVVDLTGDHLTQDLLDFTVDARLTRRHQELPAQLDEANLLRNLSSTAVAELVGEAIHSYANPGEEVGLAILDAELIATVARHLGTDVTFKRLAAGFRVLTRSYRYESSGPLTAREVEALAEEADLVHQGERIQNEVHTIRANLDMLAPAHLDNLAASTQDAAASTESTPLWLQEGVTVWETADEHHRRKDLTDHLIVQVLLQQLQRHRPTGQEGTLIVLGCSRLRQRTMELLAERARRAGVGLVTFLEHYRGDATQYLGLPDSATMIMQLRNPQQAGAAADFIGRGHTFQLSQLSETDGITDQTGAGTSFGTSETTTQNFGASAGSGFGASSGSSRSQGSSFSSSANWSTARSKTTGATRVRSYDLTVEPTSIQALDATTFLLIDAHDNRRRVVAANCDPRIATLDRVASAPRRVQLPPPPSPLAPSPRP